MLPVTGHGGEAVSGERDEDEVRPTGRFRVYLGAAAGVGKTCAMLDEGWRRYRRGADVVIGYVETHGRPYTVCRSANCRSCPASRWSTGGRNSEEMDLQAVLDRRPEVVLIDELAHTNVPGSGVHEKRWQDVLAILDAGIAVITTVNIQHVESLADAVERITGVTIGERVPDWVVRRADQLELIDSSADQLRRRMLHGNIYPAAKVHAALSGFFRMENLVALRELSLRFLADETEEELLEYLRYRHDDSGQVWDTAERILVAVTGAPGNDAVIRRAARIAARSKAELLAVHVVPHDGGSRQADTAALKELVHDVGGTWISLEGDDIPATIVDTAVEHQITQVVLGTSNRSRIQSWGRGSIIQQILRKAAESGIDVHVIARRTERNGRAEEDYEE